MKIQIFDRQDYENPINGETIEEADELLDTLRRFTNRKPFLCELIGENGYNLMLGIGKLGCAQYSPGDGKPPYLLAVAPDPDPQLEEVEFLTGDTPTAIPGRNALPFSLAEEIAACFQRTGECSKSVSWEEI
jgi:hypothetical protein